MLIEEGPFETRGALLHDDTVVELQIERPGNMSRVGRFYHGRVSKILPDMNIAFVDIGEKTDGFLQLNDLQTKSKSLSSTITEGERLLLQVIKDAKRDKGPQLGTRFALHGPNLIYRPLGKGLTLSKNIKTANSRSRIEKLLSGFAENAGITVRTSANKAADSLLFSEIKSLILEWEEIMAAKSTSEKPRPVGRSESPLIRILQTLFTGDNKVIVNNAAALNAAKSYLVHKLPGIEAEIELWERQESLFEAMGANAAIDQALQKRVLLKSGGNITLEPTEAAVIIDVNSASHTERDGIRSAALSVNLEAAAEICRQIQLRNYTGTIIIDFIQMNGKGDVAELSIFLQNQLEQDSVPSRMIGMTEIGLMQITRKRTRPQLSDIMSRSCPQCDAEGAVPNDITILADLYRELRDIIRFSPGASLHIRSGTELALRLEGQKAMLERELARPISISIDKALSESEYQIL
ncbi:ribonuclease E/G [Sneathiella sp.]|uniref:ribonuclease E/G n=1 Tax=Sneathiella sp. TaxID=1964365 RepID=UPI0025F47F29|nr:ribonuclease E/G [Sneathiella sp.]